MRWVIIALWSLVACAAPVQLPPEPGTQPPDISDAEHAASQPQLLPEAEPRSFEIEVTTLAGNGRFGYQDGPAEQAQFYHPSSVILDDVGQILVMDRFNHRVRKIAGNQVSTVPAGNGERGNKDGGPEEARFNQAFSLFWTDKNQLMIVDTNNHALRLVAEDGSISTFAGTGTPGYREGALAEAKFNWPSTMVQDQDGHFYLAERLNHCIRKISADGQVTTLAGNGEAGNLDGVGQAARFNEPIGLALGPDQHLYVSDSQNHTIRRVSLKGEVTTLAGSGQPGSRDDLNLKAEFREPYGLAAAQDGMLYVVDRGNHRIRQISPEGEVTSLAGNGEAGFADGKAAQAQFSFPFGITLDTEGNLIVAEHGNHRIRKITLQSG